MQSANVEINKNKFINELMGINRDDADVNGLIEMLKKSDFFEAPMTAEAYRSYRGGLCLQALRRLDIMRTMVSSLGYSFSDTTLVIVSLLADLGKINYFEHSVRNKKVYSENGKKTDEIGKFDWVAEQTYKVKDPEKRFIYGTLGQNSERIISGYIPLTNEESVAILHLHGEFDTPNLNMATIYMSYPLAAVLSCADKLTSFVDTSEIGDAF